MIISASRRTDIPSYYSEWFINRLQAGHVMIPNPRNADRVGRVELSPSNVDCIVFWTKNPAPMMDKLQVIESMGYSFYFQFTLTPYSKKFEQHLPSVSERIKTFEKLSRLIGEQCVVWRYDPVIVDETHTVRWHLEQFKELCKRLSPYTRRCVFSFIDPYKSIQHSFTAMRQSEMIAIASGFSEIAASYNLGLFTCAEEIDLSGYGIGHSACIDKELIEQIVGCRITAKKDANQRPACRCIESVDIGAYDTCTNRCAYCYATSSANLVALRLQNHDPDATMLTGYPTGKELITDRTTPSQKEDQLRFF